MTYSLDELDNILGLTSEEESSPFSFTEDWDSVISEEAKKYPSIPESIVRSLINRESGGDPYADIDTKTKWGKARGLGQFIDETAKQYIPEWKDPSDSYDPVKNIKGIYAYLNDLYSKTGSIDKALIKYHGGGTDVLGTKSEDYAKQITGNTKDNSYSSKKMSIEEIDNLLGDVTLEEPKQQKSTDTSIFTPFKSAAVGAVDLVSDILKSMKYRSDNKFDIPEELFTRPELSGAPELDIISGINIDPKSFDIASQKVSDLIKPEVREEVSKAVSGKMIPKSLDDLPEFIQTWTSLVAQQAPQLATNLGGPALSAASLVAREKGSFIKEAENLGVSPEIISKYADQYAIPAGMSEYADNLLALGKNIPGVNKLTGTIKKKIVGKIIQELTAASAEGAQEYGQNALQSFMLGKAAKEAGLTEEQVKQKVPEPSWRDFASGFGIGLIYRGAGKFINGKEQQQETLTEQPQVEQPVQEQPQVQENKYWKFSTAEDFVAEYNSVSGPSRQFMLSQLDPAQQEEVKSLLNAPKSPVEEVSTTETTQDIPQELSATVDAPMSSTEQQPISDLEQAVIQAQEQPIEDVQEQETTPTISQPLEETVEFPTPITEETTQVEQPQMSTEEMDKLLGVENDTKDISGIRSDEQQGKTTVKEEPIKETSSEETAPSGVLQTPKKEVTKYTTKELISLAETDDRKNREKIKTIVSESGISLPKRSSWKTFVLEYAKKHGTSDDIDLITDYINKTNKNVSSGIKQKQQERLIKHGDNRTKTSRIKSIVLKQILDKGIVPFSKIKHGFITNGEVDEDNNIIYKENSKQYKHILDIKEIDGKKYILLNDKNKTSERKLQDIIYSIKTSSYNQNIKTNKEEDKTKTIDEKEAELNIKKQEEMESAGKEAVAEFQEIPEEEEKKEFKSDIIKRLDEQLKNKEITKEQYDKSIRLIKKYEQDVGLAEYDEDFEDVSYSLKDNKIDKTKPIEWVDATDTQKSKAEENAKKLGLKFNGVLPGAKQEGKVVNEVGLMFTDSVKGATFVTSPDATVEQIKSKLDSKVKEFDVASQYAEVKKAFKNIGEDIPEVRITRVIPEKGQILTSRAYGAITKPKNGKSVILINPDIETSQILPTLLHELWGHFGALNVIRSLDIKLAQHAWDLFVKDSDSDAVAKLIKNYGKDRDTIFSEWLAKNFEEVALKYFDKNGKFKEKIYNADKSIRKRIYDFIEKLVNKVFDTWFKKPATKKEIHNLIVSIGQRFGDIYGNGYSDVTRYSKKDAPKKKRKGVSKKQKLKTYAEDRLKLELTTDIEDLKIRYFDFANKHFYGDNADSYRKQVFGMFEKIKEVGDPEHKKLNKIIDEFSDWEDARLAHKNYESFIKSHKKILGRESPELNSINKILKNVQEEYDKFIEYQTIKRIADRGLVDRPLKNKSTTEYKNPGEKYKNLIDKKYVDMDSFNAGSYELSDLGKEAYKKLRVDLTTESGDLFGANDINTMMDEAKTKLKDYYSTQKDLKSERDKRITANVELIRERIKVLRSSIGKGKVYEGALDWLKNADLSTTNLEYIVNKLDGFTDGAFTKSLFEPLDVAREKVFKIKHEILDVMEKELSKIPRKELIKMNPSFQSGIVGTFEKNVTNKPTVTKFVTEKGQKIDLTPAQRISIYMLSKNQSGLRHLLNGGVSLTHKSEVVKMSPKDIANIVESINENEKIVANMYFKISEILKEKGNKVSNKDIGFDIFTEENYHPLLIRKDHISDKDEIKEIRNVEDLRQYIIRTSPAALKRRVKSDAPVILEGVFDAFSRVAPMVEKYIGAALPSKEVRSILNNKGIEKSMNEKGLDVELNMIKKLVDNFNGDILHIPQGGEKFLRTVQNIFTGAVLGYKIPVALIQPTSYYSYITSIPDLSLPKKIKIVIKGHLGAMPNGEFKRIKDLIWQYSPALKERFGGHGDVAIGEAMKSSESRNRVTGGKRGWRKWASNEGALAPMIAMDQRTVAMVWRAVEEEFKEQGITFSSDGFYRNVAKKTWNIIRRTQATSDMLDRPNVMNSMVFKPITMFTSEPIKRMMMVRRSIHMLKDDPQRGLTNLALLLVVQPLMIEVIRTSILKARGKDDLPEEASEYLSWFAKRIAINNIGMYPILGAAISTAMSGFDVNFGGPLQEFVKRAVTFSRHMWESTIEGKSWDDTLKSLRRLSAMLGPVDAGVQAKEIIDSVIEQVEE